jgi:hypothetical protein
VSKMLDNDTNENGDAICCVTLSICFVLEYKIRKKIRKKPAVNPLFV